MSAAPEVVEVSEALVPAPALALAGLLDVPAPDPEHDAVPPLWHWVYLLDRPPQAALGPDGHRLSGSVPVPPGPNRRRMIAGGRVRTSGQLRFGAEATRHSSVRSSVEKHGRSGRLVFVTVAHDIRQGGRTVVEEEVDIVYRDAESSGAPVAPVAADPAGSSTEPAAPLAPGESRFPIDITRLFRFSALTYNAHRIHYDRDYARDVEGYPGLVVHGPLQAILMAGVAARTADVSTGTASVFSYRLVEPLFDRQGLVVAATTESDAVVTSVRDDAGRTTARGRFEFEVGA